MIFLNPHDFAYFWAEEYNSYKRKAPISQMTCANDGEAFYNCTAKFKDRKTQETICLQFILTNTGLVWPHTTKQVVCPVKPLSKTVPHV